MVERAYDLGREGEAAARRLLASVQIGVHFEPVLVLARFPETLAELRRRLEATAGRFDRLEPGAQIAGQLAELAAAVTPSGGRRVTWIEAASFDVPRWKETLASFNQRREWMQVNTPWLIVLAGPLQAGPENLNNLAGRHAPDFFSISTTLLIDEEPRFLEPSPSRPIRWLHLSDFHFTAFEGWDRRRTLKALLVSLAEKKAAGWRPDFVFATGDIANTGKEKEYDQAFLFFRELGKALEIDLPGQLFLIPGNHDVDRGAKGPMDDSILDGLLKGEGAEQQENIARALEDAGTMRLLGRRLEQYYTFTERLLGPARLTQIDRPWRVDLREVGGVEVAILQLNSAWASGQSEEKGRLLVGAHQLERALEEAASAKVRFVLIHHPSEYLADNDAASVRGRLLARGGAHFSLRGHFHATATESLVNLPGGLIELAAGAAYATTRWPRTFLTGEADLVSGQAAIELFAFSDSGKGFWAIDTLTYCQTEEGKVLLPLPNDLVLGIGAGDGGPESKASHRPTVVGRYRAAVAAVHGQMRFIGFPSASGHRSNVGVQELFVPLRLAVAGPEKGVLSTARLVERLVPREENAKVDRFVVLGEPGSGKTTLCRFATVALAGAAGAPPAAPFELLPLFLPFGDYVRQCRESDDCGLLEFLASQARHHLQVSAMDAAALEEAVEQGRAVLLLDGFDEVGSENERVRMRDRVLAFCEQHPRLPVLVTSRSAGYDRAPLPESSFQRLDLRSFEDEDLRQFVTNWYAIREPNDPVARGRGVADLLAALATEPRIRALASNPLLATLIALVHRSEVRLPGERAKLYELCVRTLLETWPWQADRRFTEIDEGLQRVYLEDFALRHQERRIRPEASVSFGREEVVWSLSEILGRFHDEERQDSLQRLAERWVDFLATGTGILVEKQPGVFGFVHLSLLEYLAACALDRQQQSLESQIERLQNDSVWREVLLLAVGRHAADLLFLKRLWDTLENSEGDFLLLCLREEAAFGSRKRTEILDRLAGRYLDYSTFEAQERQLDLRLIERFSTRHGHQVREWRADRLSSSVGEKLQAVVALTLDQLEMVKIQLARRNDPAQSAADLLAFWPGFELGGWLAKLAPEAAVFKFFREAPIESSTLRAIASLENDLPVIFASAGAAAFLKSAALIFRLAARAEKLCKETSGSLPLSRWVVTRPSGISVNPSPRWPRSGDDGQAGEIPGTIFSRNFFLEGNAEWAASAVEFFAWHLASFPSMKAFDGLEFSPSSLLLDEVVREVALNGGLQLARDFNQMYIPALGRWDFGSYFASRLAENFGIDFSDRADPAAERPDSGSVNRVERQAFDSLLRGTVDRNSAGYLIAERQLAEVWSGLVPGFMASRVDQRVYTGYRLQNVDVLFLWPYLDELLQKEPPPEKLALYLQLGWTQSTTTYEWPATERWIGLMKAGPPAHWLPRAQWHLCWLLYDNTDAEHQRAFNEALREGLADPDVARHAVAETLEQVIGFYP